jgi:hypothetical protein
MAKSEFDWSKEIAHAQTITHYVVDGAPLPRIRFGDAGGDEDYESDETCGDCAVAKGQLHVVYCEVGHEIKRQ